MAINTIHPGSPDPDDGKFRPVAGEERDLPCVVERDTVPAVAKVIDAGPAGPGAVGSGREDEALGRVADEGISDCPHASVPIVVVSRITRRLICDLLLDLHVAPLFKPLTWTVKRRRGRDGKKGMKRASGPSVF